MVLNRQGAKKLPRQKAVAFIGAVGVPNIYGGFEMFLDSTAPLVARHFDQVLITCDRGRYSDREQMWRGVQRVFVPLPANGGWSVFHDLIAFFIVFWRVDVVVVLGVSGGIFFPLFRVLCAIRGVRLIVNVDGLEWRRNKFSCGKRGFLYLSDRLAQFFAHCVIVDNEALRPYLILAVRKSAVFIPYPGDHARLHNVPSTDHENPYCLTICRIEPENNCHVLLAAFAAAGTGRYIFVGNWDDSEYARQLRFRFGSHPRIDLRWPTYDQENLARLRGGCGLYLHGHSVGGTNPSLVEMLFYDCPILAFDCAFNRATAEDAIEYFANQTQLEVAISSLVKGESGATAWVQKRDILRRTKYMREIICSAYVAVIRQT